MTSPIQLKSGGFPRFGTQVSVRETLPLNLAKTIVFGSDATSNTNSKNYPINTPASDLLANPSMPPTFLDEAVIKWTGQASQQIAATAIVVTGGGSVITELSGASTGDVVGNVNIVSASNPRITLYFGYSIKSIANNGSGGIRVESNATLSSLSTGTTVKIHNATTNTNANGVWTVTKIDSTHFDLNASTFAATQGAGGVAAIAPTNMSWRLLASGTFSNFDNFVVCQLAREAAVSAGTLVDPDYTAVLVASGAKWLRFMDPENMQGAWDGAFSARVPKDVMYWPQSAGWNNPNYVVGTLTNTGVSGAFTDVYTCGAPSLTKTGAYQHGEVIQGVFSATNTGGYPGLNVNGRGIKRIIDGGSRPLRMKVSAAAASAGQVMTFTFTASWLNGGVAYPFPYTTTASGPNGSDLTSASILAANIESAIILDATFTGKVVTHNDGGGIVALYHVTPQTGSLLTVTYSGPVSAAVYGGVLPSTFSSTGGRGTFIFNYIHDAWYYQPGGLVQSTPLEYFVELCNSVGASCWWNWPILTTLDYVTGVTGFFRDNLRSDLSFGTEVGNEMWNFGQQPWGFALSLGYALGCGAAQRTANLGSYSYTAMRTVQFGAAAVTAWTTTRSRATIRLLAMSAQWDIENTRNYSWEGSLLDATRQTGGVALFGTYGGPDGTSGTTNAASSLHASPNRPCDTTIDGYGIAPYWGSSFLGGDCGNGQGTNTLTGTVLQNAPLLNAALKWQQGNTSGAYDDLYSHLYTAVNLGGPGGGLNLLRNYKNDNYPQLETLMTKYDLARGKKVVMMHYEAGPQIGLEDVNNGTNSATSSIPNILFRLNANAWDVSPYVVSGSPSAYTELATSLNGMVYGFKFSPQYAALYTNYFKDITYVHVGRECIGSNYGFGGPSQWGYFPGSALAGVAGAYSSLQATADFNAGR